MFIEKMSSFKNVIFVLFLNNVLMMSLIAMDTREIATGTKSFGGGWVSGRACVIKGCSPFDVCAGDIVVVPTINKSWANILNGVAGIVVEQECNNNYAAKLGKPVIVVPGATQKIIHGSSISFDCTKKIVYEVFYSVYRCPINSQNLVGYFSSHSKFSHINWFTSESSAAHVSCDKVTKNNNKEEKKMNIGQTKESYCNGIPITKERLLADKPEIEQDIDSTGNKIGWANTCAWLVRGKIVKAYTFDSMPNEFFANKKRKEKAFKNFENEENVKYIQEKKEAFKNEILKDKSEINKDEIAEFLYKEAVANIDISDDLRKELLEDPKKMDIFVQKKWVNRKEYMNITLCNLTVQYYLEKELELKNKKL